MITTEAWVLYQGSGNTQQTTPAALKKESYSFPDITDSEVLVAPIYGCWEANMTHAIERLPVDICRLRGEERVVLGNAGVVRVLKTGTAVTSVHEGDLCCLAGIGTTDPFGYFELAYAYDAPHTIGMMAKQIKLHENQLALIPQGTKYSPLQWAAFSARYPTAWANWKLAYGCWRLQMTEDRLAIPYVWGWGGGVTLAELTLAKYSGCRLAMMSSGDERLAQIHNMGIKPIDRRQFLHLNYDDRRYRSDRDYTRAYHRDERTFLKIVQEETDGLGASIFIDNVGLPVFRATLRALGRQGVLATAGWKRGMELKFARARECMNHHIHVFSHGCRYAEGVAAMRFAEQTGWMPPIDDNACHWNDIPQLAHDYAQGTIGTYFPMFQVNEL